MATKQQIENARDAAVNCANMYAKWRIEAAVHLRDILRPDLHPHDNPDGPYLSIIALRQDAESRLKEYDGAMLPGILSAIHAAVGRIEPVTLGPRSFASWHQAARLCVESVLFVADYEDAEQMLQETRGMVEIDAAGVVAQIDLEAAAAIRAMQGDTPASPGGGDGTPGKPKRGDADSKVAEYLKSHPTDDHTTRSIGAAIGRAHSTVGDTPAWSLYKAHKDSVAETARRNLEGKDDAFFDGLHDED